MKLPDFMSNGVFDKLRSKMNIPKNYLRELDYEHNLKEIDLLKVKFEAINNGIGLDVNLDELEIGKDNTIIFENKNVILYIRDQYSYDTQYKYHISWCRTLQSMRDNNKLNRYVISRRNDGTFYVNVLDKSNHNPIKKEVIRSLCICKNCLNEINYKGYRVAAYNEKNNIYNNFSILEFLEQYDTNFNQLPKYNEKNAPLNIYAKNWSDISREYRQYTNWKCEECNLDCSNNPGYLDVHHIDSNKSNNKYSNLRALCKKCHANQYGHSAYKNLIKDKI